MTQLPPGQWGPPPLQSWPAAPPRRGRSWKWVAIAAGVLAVVAAVVVVLVSRTSGGTGGVTGSGVAPVTSAVAPPDIASAADTGPVGIITEDPSCGYWGAIAKTLTAVETKDWTKRDRSHPAALWTPQERAVYEEVAQAMRTAADQTVPLVKSTTHRVMRELYGQFMAYARAYADAVPNYVEIDGHLGAATNDIRDVLSGICGAIAYTSAGTRTSLVPPAAPPAQVAPVGDPAHPTKFMPTPDGQCANWKAVLQQRWDDPMIKKFEDLDGVPSSDTWTPEEKAATQAVGPVITRLSDSYENVAHQSSNPFIADLGVLTAQYGRAFVAAIPTYAIADMQLYYVFGAGQWVIGAACAASGAFG